MNWTGHLGRWALSAVLGIAAVPCVAQQPATIAETERVLPAIIRQGQADGLRVSFFARGRTYHLRLESNPRLERWSRGSWHQYRGAIEGIANSWARLAVAPGAMRGVMYDGQGLIAIEPADDGQLTVFRVSDLRFPTPLSFAGDERIAPAGLESALVGRAAPPMEALTADRKLEISVLGDASFRARYASDQEARDAILTRVNIVDGFFSAQLGTAIEVASVDLSAESGGALDASTDPPILLDSLGLLRQQTPSLNSRGLTHLFTGRNLDGDSVGIAYSSALCRARYSASLAQAHDSAAVDGLVTAHEIAHVFGAPHDGEGACAAVPQGRFIMSPVLNSQATTFSQCSLDQMARLVAEAPCLMPVSPPDLALPSSLGTHDATTGTKFDWRFAITNEGGRAATEARVTVQITPAIELVSASAEAGSCVVQASLATCDVARVEAGESVQLSLVVRGATAGTYSAHAQVVSTGDATRSNDEADGTLRVQAAGSAPPPGGPGEPGGSGGGGAVDDALLAVLALMLAVAVRRRLIRAPWCVDRGWRVAGALPADQGVVSSAVTADWKSPPSASR